jgi:hypothetical protein
MSQPPAPYDRQYNFTSYQTANPSAPLPGQKVDQELNAVLSAVNDTQSRLGEIQADDGTIRTSALNIQVIAEEVEPLLTDAPILAVEQAGAQQVGLVNDAGDAKIADMLAILSSQNAQDAIAAKDAAESAADIAASSATLANGYAGSAQAYANTALQAKNSAIVHAQAAQDAAASIPLIVGPVGPQGSQGIQGIQGVEGQPGVAGQQGIQGPAGNAWVYQGEYNNGITYSQHDYVTLNGSSYVLKNFIGAAGYDPIGYPENWQLVAQKGDTGANGADGADGVGVVNWRGEFNPGQFYFNGDVVSYNGSSYAHSMPGSGSNQGNYPDVSPFYWTLVAQAGSQGVTGDTGAPGQTGAVGPAGPSIAPWDGNTTYYDGNAVTYNNAIFVCVSGGITGGNYPPDSAAWVLASDNYFARTFTVYEKVNRSGDTFNGKVNFTPVGGVAGLNIGIGGTSAAATTAGDLWITTGGANLNFRDGTGAWKVLASLQNGNVFSAVQAVDVTSTSTALRVTQKGTGNAIQVEDSTSPDSTAFVVDQFGKVGVGTAPDATAAIRVDANGISFNGLSFNPTSTTSHTGGSDTMDLLVTIGGVNYRIGLRPA